MRHPDADADPNSDSNSDAYANSDADADADATWSDAFADSYSNSYSDADAYSDAHTDANFDFDPHSDEVAKPDSDTHGYPNTLRGDPGKLHLHHGKSRVYQHHDSAANGGPAGRPPDGEPRLFERVL